MLSKRSLHALSSVERQALGQHARRPGQCIRCFHASIRQTAEHEVSGKGASQEESKKGSSKANLVENVQARPSTPGNFDSASPHQPTKPASMQDRRRHQRSAMISEEVQMVQRDHPSPSFSGDNPNATPQQPSPTAQTTNPEGSAMGANDPASREGPTGQGIGRAVATEEDVPDSSVMARGARSPHEGVEEPSAGGAAVMGASSEGRQTVRLAEEEEEDLEDEEDTEGEAPVQTRRRVAEPYVTEPSKALSKDNLLYSGQETSTIAGGNVQGVISDHLRMIAHPGEKAGSERDPRQLAAKMMAGQLVHFRSEAEKVATNDFARKRTGQQASNQARRKGSAPGETRPAPPKSYFAPVPEGVRKSITDVMVKGVYDPEGVLEGKQKYKNPLLNDLARSTLMNSTYMKSDGDRFLRKVQSLLPATPNAQQQRAGRPQQQARAK